MKTSIRIVDYYLKERIERQNSKITTSGRTYRLREKFAPSSRRPRAYRLETVVIEVVFDIS
jgi:hypothetical protein